MTDDRENRAIVDATARIVSAHVRNCRVGVSDVGLLIETVYSALSELDAFRIGVAAEPAVAVQDSIMPDYLICLEDGSRHKLLKAHLARQHNLTAAEYRAKWKLPSDYPMVSPTYSAQRRASAVKHGLGRSSHSRRTSPN